MSVVRLMLDDVDRRRNTLGVRAAAKDIENCLEDTVSIYEAVLKALVRRHKLHDGESEDDIDRIFKKIGNAFQNIKRSEDTFSEIVGLKLFEDCSVGEVDILSGIFEKRHPITHNLGVVDKKYIEKALTSEKEGKEVLVTINEIQQARSSSGVPRNCTIWPAAKS